MISGEFRGGVSCAQPNPFLVCFSISTIWQNLWSTSWIAIVVVQKNLQWWRLNPRCELSFFAKAASNLSYKRFQWFAKPSEWSAAKPGTFWRLVWRPPGPRVSDSWPPTPFRPPPCGLCTWTPRPPLPWTPGSWMPWCPTWQVLLEPDVPLSTRPYRVFSSLAKPFQLRNIKTVMQFFRHDNNYDSSFYNIFEFQHRSKLKIISCQWMVLIQHANLT